MIFAGLGILTHKHEKKKWHHRHRPRKVVVSSGTDELIDEVAIFSGSERNITTDAFKGGNVTAVFGGNTFDFSNSQLAEGKNVLEMSLIFGGCKMIVPSDWNVKIEVATVFGGFIDKRVVKFNPDNTKLLVIKGVAVFGGGEINSI